MDAAPNGSTPETLVATTEAADDVDRFRWDGDGLEPELGLALSGGGFRAMLFHAGALLRLNELGLLSRLDRISSVSGGSIAAGLLATSWSRLGPSDASGAFPNLRREVTERLVAFSRSTIDVWAGLGGLLPGTSIAEEVAKRYRPLVGEATLQDLPDQPRFVLCATNLQTGVLWRFTKPYAGDYVVGQLPNPRIPLATAMAASSAFPPFLSPLTLKVEADAFGDWPNRPGRPPAPGDQRFRTAIRLADGGVYDNHGLEPLLKRTMTVFASDGGAPFARVTTGFPDWFRQLRRVLEITDNQVRSLRRRDLIARYEAAEKKVATGALTAGSLDPYGRLGAYWGIGTDPGPMTPPGHLTCRPDVVQALARVSTRLADPGHGVAERLVNWGYAVSDLCIRTHYRGFEPLADRPPSWPYSAFALDQPVS